MLGPQPMESWQKHDSTMITIADSINPESQFNPKWKSEHESAMEIYEEIKERADPHKQAKISLM